ncbi:MAG: RNA polymerase sigma factor [Gammaproteobacteria bacterium]
MSEMQTERNETLQAALAGLNAPVISYLRRYCGDEQLAQDLAQETLIRIARALPEFNQRSSLKTWAFSIANRVTSDHFRRTAQTVTEISFDDDMEFVDDAPETLQRVIIDEMNACVRQVIDTLPEAYRAALILRDLEGFSIAEVAAVSGCSLATAKIRIHRARKRLEEALGQACEFYSDTDDILRCERK